jgi:SAM-dependent methyltransferase
MPDKSEVLSPSAAQAYFDQFGKKQNSQGFYENPALDDLIAHASFQDARSVFEFGCGTGKFAAHLLENHLSPTASYLGCDISHDRTCETPNRELHRAGASDLI